MKSGLEINGAELQNIRAAAERTGYSRDYITRLAREEKIIASQIGRQWFVDIDSLKEYATEVANEQSFRHQQLSEERRQERLAQEKRNTRVKKNHTRTRRGMVLQSHTLAVGVLSLGLGLGFLLNQLPTFSSDYSTQVASAPSVQPLEEYTVEDRPVGEKDITSGVEFSHESVGLATMEGASEGILLLPGGTGSSSNPAKLFSDDVRVMVDEHGQQFIARLNDHGQMVERIPFVVVPVTSSSTP
ncbi:MAG: helix-turn-helix domain-containing protein [Candidatus Pacebacteria bacterium]|nr:helix-turn-helix domain-containing protein [Candidatus Paceibacterota bacterium]MBP9842545.1 helix-turn-helix domain-containing protein [Candidatus Paceibacterota bacterium]